MFDIEEIEELLDDIRIRVLEANRRGTLEGLLKNMGMLELLKPTCTFESYREGKIVVIGDSKVKEAVLCSIVENVGIDKRRLEFCLEYDQTQKYNYKKLQCAPQYRVVLFGAVPHSSTGKCDSSSVIAEMESNKDYPRVVRLCSNNEIKITKSNFKNAIVKLVEEQYI